MAVNQKGTVIFLIWEKDLSQRPLAANTAEFFIFSQKTVKFTLLIIASSYPILKLC